MISTETEGLASRCEALSHIARSPAGMLAACYSSNRVPQPMTAPAGPPSGPSPSAGAVPASSAMLQAVAVERAMPTLRLGAFRGLR